MAHTPCNLSSNGSISLGLNLGGESYLDTPGGGGDDFLLDHFPLVDAGGLLELDDPQPGAP